MPPDAHQTDEEKFRTFVNKIAQICDSHPKGPTITSCAVLKEENGRVLYLLASNNRKSKAHREMGTFLVSVLDVLKKNILASRADKLTDEKLNNRLLRMVLAYNHVRVQSYVSTLATQLEKCVKKCRGPVGDEGE